MDFKMTNSIVHLLFLVESLLLKKAAPVIRPGIRPKKIPRPQSVAMEAIMLVVIAISSSPENP